MSSGADAPTAAGRAAEYRIEELAEAAGTTPRNIRAYQDRGLLPPPRRVGRIGWYDDDHLSRLRIIGTMLDRGFTLQSIGELVEALERGDDLAAVIGIEAVVGGPFATEAPTYVTAEELLTRFGDQVDVSLVVGALELGIIEADGSRFKVPSPRLLSAGVELVRAGVPPKVLLDQLRRLRQPIDELAGQLVDMVVTHVIDPHGTPIPDPAALPEIAETVIRIRPLADMVVSGELARALQRHTAERLGERLGAVLALLDTRSTARAAS